jgi:DNA-binding MarR family transcriptional regulator
MTTPWLTEEEQRAWRGFLFVNLKLHERLSREMGAASSLSYTDYMILVALTDQTSYSLRLYEISEALGWEKSRLSHHVARMVERGLVERCECPGDRRGTSVIVTPYGREQLEAEAPHHVAAVRKLFVDRLTPDQLGVLATLPTSLLPMPEG